MRELFQTVYEDAELLVINKPAGLVCHPTKTDEYSSLISRARLYLGPGSQPQLVNRLDRETSGLTLVAKTNGAARKLRKIWEERRVKKEYLAIVHGRVGQPKGIVNAPLGKDEVSRVAIKDRVRPDGAVAATEYSLVKHFERDVDVVGHAPLDVDAVTSRLAVPRSLVISTAGSPGVEQRSPRSFSLLQVIPQTGRKHQIRIHLAYLGYPIVGDKIYGGEEDLYLALVENRLTSQQRARLILPYHALHASQIAFPWGDGEVVFHADPELWFQEFIG